MSERPGHNPDPGFEEEELRVALEAAFLAEESGEEIDVGAICRGNTALEEAVRECLGLSSNPGLLPGEEKPDSPPSATLNLPSRLGDFELLEVIGRGGMGTVYRARQLSLDRLVAVKLLLPSIWADPLARLRFRREAELTAALEHPNIAPVYEIGEAESVGYLAVKLLAGPSLDLAPLPLEPRDVAYIGSRIARALHTAHLAGIVHRDVKPANILLDEGVPYIVDFGLARSFGSTSLTRPNVVPGTLPYMAPEELRESAEPVSPAVDIYALGATLYELASGTRAFEGERSSVLIRKILLDEPRTLRLPRASRDLGTVIGKALEKQAAQRFSTAAEMADDLERFLQDKPIRSKPPSLASRAEKLLRRHRRTALVVGFAAVLFALSGTMLVRQSLLSAQASQREIVELERALETRDFEAAHRALERLDAVDASHPRRAPLAARLDEAESFEQLIDQVVDRQSGVLADVLRIALERDFGDRTEGRERIWSLARAQGFHLLGRNGAARAALDRARDLGASHASCEALGRLLGGEPVAPTNEAAAKQNDSVETRILEVILEVAARRLLGDSLAVQERTLAAVHPLLGRAKLSSRTRDRVVFAGALARIDAGRTEDAIVSLELLTAGPRPVRTHLRALAAAYLHRGDAEAASATLERIPRESWGTAEALAHIDLAFRAGDWDRAQVLLDEGRETWEVNEEWTCREARVRLYAGEDPDTVLAEFEMAIAAAEVSDSIVARTVEAIRTELERAVLFSEVDSDGAFEAERLQAFLDRAAARSASLPPCRARGKIDWLTGGLLLQSGRPREALECLQRAADQVRLESGATVDLVTCLSLLAADPEADRYHVRSWKLQALRLTDRLLCAMDRGEIRIPDEDLVALLNTAEREAYSLSDFDAHARLLTRLESLESTPEQSARAAEARRRSEAAFGSPAKREK